MSVLTRVDLARLAPRADDRIAAAVVAQANVVFAKWRINTPQRLWMVMAQLCVESGGFARVFENMNYSASGLLSTWPTHFTREQAERYGRAPGKPADGRMIANLAYGGRMGNRGPDTDDGWECRGQGLCQTTGMDGFKRLARALGVTVEQCRAMLTADATMLECAVATFVEWGCLPHADRGDVTAATKAINGGLNGLADRQAAYAKARLVWPAPVFAPGAPGPVAAAVETVKRANEHIPSVAPIEPPDLTPAAETWGDWLKRMFFRRTTA